MDNSTEGKNNQSEDMTYSSQDILSSSLAGKKESLFTRVKKTNPLFGRKKKASAVAPEQKPARRRLSSINQKQLIKIAIIVFAALLLVGVVATIILIANNQDDSAKVIEENEDEDDEPAYTEEEEAYTEEIPEEIAALQPDQTDENIGVVDYVAAQVNYINALVDANLIETATNEMESVMSEIEMDPDAFTDCQLASAYRTSLRIQEADIARLRAAGQDVADPTTEEDENSDADENGVQYYTASVIERMKKATEVCNE